MSAVRNPRRSLGTFTGSLVGLIEHIGQEHRAFLANLIAHLIPGKQYLMKRIFDKLQSVHYQTLQLSVILTTIKTKKKVAQPGWDAIAERIHMAGESGTPLHLKIEAYYVDIA